MSRGDWVPCQGWGEQFGAVAAQPATNILLVRHGELFAAQAAVAVVEDSDDIVVERVVGQLDVFETGEDPVLVLMRIRLGLYDDANNLAAFYADDFNDGPQANEPFLWQRVVQATEIRLIDPIVSPAWSMVDVKVSRRIKRDQALFLSVQAVNADCIFTPWLRSWARNVG